MKETVAWECAHCGIRYLFHPRDSVSDLPPVVDGKCGSCGKWTKGKLARIGKNAWALTNPREA